MVVLRVRRLPAEFHASVPLRLHAGVGVKPRQLKFVDMAVSADYIIVATDASALAVYDRGRRHLRCQLNCPVTRSSITAMCVTQVQHRLTVVVGTEAGDVFVFSVLSCDQVRVSSLRKRHASQVTACEIDDNATVIFTGDSFGQIVLTTLVHEDIEESVCLHKESTAIVQLTHVPSDEPAPPSKPRPRPITPDGSTTASYPSPSPSTTTTTDESLYPNHYGADNYKLLVSTKERSFLIGRFEDAAGNDPMICQIGSKLNKRGSFGSTYRDGYLYCSRPSSRIWKCDPATGTVLETLMFKVTFKQLSADDPFAFGTLTPVNTATLTINGRPHLVSGNVECGVAVVDVDAATVTAFRPDIRPIRVCCVRGDSGGSGGGSSGGDGGSDGGSGQMFALLCDRKTIVSLVLVDDETIEDEPVTSSSSSSTPLSGPTTGGHNLLEKARDSLSSQGIRSVWNGVRSALQTAETRLKGTPQQDYCEIIGHDPSAASPLVRQGHDEDISQAMQRTEQILQEFADNQREEETVVVVGVTGSGVGVTGSGVAVTGPGGDASATLHPFYSIRTPPPRDGATVPASSPAAGCGGDIVFSSTPRRRARKSRRTFSKGGRKHSADTKSLSSTDSNLSSDVSANQNAASLSTPPPHRQRQPSPAISEAYLTPPENSREPSPCPHHQEAAVEAKDSSPLDQCAVAVVQDTGTCAPRDGIEPSLRDAGTDEPAASVREANDSDFDDTPHRTKGGATMHEDITTSNLVNAQPPPPPSPAIPLPAEVAVIAVGSSVIEFSSLCTPEVAIPQDTSTTTTTTTTATTTATTTTITTATTATTTATAVNTSSSLENSLDDFYAKYAGGDDASDGGDPILDTYLSISCATNLSISSNRDSVTLSPTDTTGGAVTTADCWSVHKTPAVTVSGGGRGGGGGLISLCSTERYLFCVTDDLECYKSDLGDDVLHWKKYDMRGKLLQLSVSSNETVIWALREDNTLWAWLNKRLARDSSKRWMQVALNVKYISVCNTAAWYILLDGSIVMQKELSATMPLSKSIRVDTETFMTGQMMQVKVHNNATHVVAMNDLGILYVRLGCDLGEEQGEHWKQITDMITLYEPLNIENFDFGFDASFWCVDSLQSLWTTEDIYRDDVVWFQILLTDYLLDNADTRTTVPLPAVVRRGQLLTSRHGGLFLHRTVQASSGRQLIGNRSGLAGHNWTIITGDQVKDMRWVNFSLQDHNSIVWLQHLSGDLFTLTTDIRGGSGGGHMQAVETPGATEQPLVCVSACEGDVWTLTCEGGLYIRDGQRWVRQSTQQLDGVRLIHVSIGCTVALAVDAGGGVYLRGGGGVSASDDKHLVPVWVPLDGQANQRRRFEKIYVGCTDLMIWAIDNMNGVYVRKGVCFSLPIGTHWICIKGCTAVEIAISRRNVYLLSPGGEIMQRHGVHCTQRPEGDYWRTLPGHFVRISVTSDDRLWALDADHRLCRRRLRSIDTEFSYISTSIGGDEDGNIDFEII